MKLWVSGGVEDLNKSCKVKIEITGRELSWLVAVGSVLKATHIYVDVGNDIHREISVEVKG